jgi:hypothetical protein
LVQDLISPLEKQIKEQLADRQTKKPPAAMSSGRGGTTRRVVAKKAGGSYKGTEKGKKRASPPTETVERGRNKRLKSVVGQTCNETLDRISVITNCEPHNDSRGK